MNSMSCGLVLRPKGKEFRSNHGIGTRGELKKKEVEWAGIAIRFTKGGSKRRRMSIELSKNILK